MKLGTLLSLGLWALQVGDIVIGDDAKGGAEIACDQEHLCKIDRIAICLAGIEAQHVFNVPTHDHAGLHDLGRFIEIAGQDASEAEHNELRSAGYRRANELILLHKTKAIRLATMLLERGEVKSHELADVMR
jgi:hypothetical protein